MTDRTPESEAAMIRAKILTEAVSKLREAQYAQRPNTTRHTHYAEAAEIVHRMIND